jgi:hypothetical protein
MDQSAIIPELAKTLGLSVSENETVLNREWLAGIIDNLLDKDFERLVFLLYRMDVNEDKLKRLLKENEGRDAGIIIADLMIERQLQKIKSREEHLPKEDIDDEERW